MGIIIPAILPRSRADLDSALARLEPIAGVETVQIDIVDGMFAKPSTWPYASHEKWELPLSERFRYDLDLMVLDPDSSIKKWVELGASRITLHAESIMSLAHTMTTFKEQCGHEAGFTPGLLSFGLALGTLTPLSLIEPYMAGIDYVQLMGIATIGRQGQPFDAQVLPKIRTLRAKYPKLAIQIDGGVSLDTAPKLLAAGASRLIVGSALMRAGDLSAELATFESVGEKYGRYER